MQTDRFKLTNSKMSDRLEFKLMKAKSLGDLREN